MSLHIEIMILKDKHSKNVHMVVTVTAFLCKANNLCRKVIIHPCFPWRTRSGSPRAPASAGAAVRPPRS